MLKELTEQREKFNLKLRQLYTACVIDQEFNQEQQIFESMLLSDIQSLQQSFQSHQYDDSALFQKPPLLEIEIDTFKIEQLIIALAIVKNFKSQFDLLNERIKQISDEIYIEKIETEKSSLYYLFEITGKLAESISISNNKLVFKQNIDKIIQDYSEIQTKIIFDFKIKSNARNAIKNIFFLFVTQNLKLKNLKNQIFKFQTQIISLEENINLTNETLHDLGSFKEIFQEIQFFSKYLNKLNEQINFKINLDYGDLSDFAQNIKEIKSQAKMFAFIFQNQQSNFIINCSIMNDIIQAIYSKIFFNQQQSNLKQIIQFFQKTIIESSNQLTEKINQNYKIHHESTLNILKIVYNTLMNLHNINELLTEEYPAITWVTFQKFNNYYSHACLIFHLNSLILLNMKNDKQTLFFEIYLNSSKNNQNNQNNNNIPFLQGIVENKFIGSNNNDCYYDNDQESQPQKHEGQHQQKNLQDNSQQQLYQKNVSGSYNKQLYQEKNFISLKESLTGPNVGYFQGQAETLVILRLIYDYKINLQLFQFKYILIDPVDDQIIEKGVLKSQCLIKFKIDQPYAFFQLKITKEELQNQDSEINKKNSSTFKKDLYMSKMVLCLANQQRIINIDQKCFNQSLCNQAAKIIEFSYKSKLQPSIVVYAKNSYNQKVEKIDFNNTIFSGPELQKAKENKHLYLWNVCEFYPQDLINIKNQLQSDIDQNEYQ